MDNKLMHAKGEGFWKMNWVAEGQKELSDDRSVLEWTKFNIRSHAIQLSKKRARSRKLN